FRLLSVENIFQNIGELLSLLPGQLAAWRMDGRSIIADDIDIFMFWHLEKFVDGDFVILILFERQFSDDFMWLHTCRPNRHVVYIADAVIAYAIFFDILNVCMMENFDIVFYEPICDMGLNFWIECLQNRPSAIEQTDIEVRPAFPDFRGNFNAAQSRADDRHFSVSFQISDSKACMSCFGKALNTFRILFGTFDSMICVFAS